MCFDLTILQEEEREATFHPQINQHSVKLHQRMMRQGRDVRRDQPMRSGKKTVVVGGTGTADDPGHEEEKFHPKINKNSRRVPTDKSAGSDAYSRLYNQGIESTMRKRAKEAELVDQHVAGVPGVGTRAPLSMRSQEFTQSRMHGAKAGAMTRQQRQNGGRDDAGDAVGLAQMSDVVSVIQIRTGVQESRDLTLCISFSPSQSSVLGAKPSDLLNGQFGAATSSVKNFTAVDYNPKMAFIFTLFDTPFPADE